MRVPLAVLAAACAALALGVALHACAIDSSRDCTSNDACPDDSGTDASTDTTQSGEPIVTILDAQESLNNVGDASEGFTCDPTKSPHDEPCVVDDAYGVFVAPPANGGDDALGDGTKGTPYATIGKALAGLRGKSRVYICGATYAEQLTISTAASLYGGLACPGQDARAPWSYVGIDSLARVPSPASDWALKIDGIGTPIAIEDVDFTASNAYGQDTSGNGKSSIAALVNASTVTFRRCALTAGSGDHGNDGITGSNFPIDTVTASDGSSNDGETGGSGGSIDCTNGTSSTGGSGGNGSPDGSAAGGDGEANPMPATTSPLDGLGGSGGSVICRQGDPGASGLGCDGGNAAASHGTLTANGWTPSAGGNGSAGNPGQGGGGGGGKSGPLLGGTGGGAGGCGGAGGTGGGGGGASVALACIASTVTLDACVLATSTGGNGGKGGDGQTGQGGGTPRAQATFACTGGLGGNGAGGCGGAGGTGGTSACVVYTGSPMIGSMRCVNGVAGTAGSGGRGGDGGANALGTGVGGGNGADGLAGVAQASLGVP
jgi:hypothetical protein